MPKPNDRIGPYQLINRLGKGSFGEVWLAQPENEKSPPVALKLPNDPDLDFDALLQETAVWARAGKHPNVVEFIAARVFDHQAVIVSEFVPDGSLEQWLKSNGGRAPSIESAIEMTCGILNGLEHLHAKSIIHRDLKPANILMDGNTPRLADFGHSRVLASTMHSSIVAGTPAYMAPEAFKRKRNQQTDLWSVAVMLYQMLSGRLPFNGADITELYGAILNEEPEPLPVEIPEWLRQIVTKALIKNPEQRFKTAAEMRVALVPQPPTIKEALTLQPNVFVIEADRESPIIELSPKSETTITKLSPSPDLAGPEKQRIRIRWDRLTIVVALMLILSLVNSALDRSLPTLSRWPDFFGQFSGVTKLPNIGEEFTENLNGVELKMIRLPGREFLMGSPENEQGRGSDEGPQHRVTVPSFYIGKYEVTQAQWKSVIGNNPSNFKGDDLPVENVSWNDAKSFCEKLSRMTSKPYRLPTEAEWEYACRAGTTTPFAFGSSLSSEQANFVGDSPYGGEAKGVYRKKTTNVRSFSPNKFGLFDMHGNVFEWCEDVWHDSYNGAPSDGSAWLSGGDLSFRVLRGGAWHSPGDGVRSASRLRDEPGVPGYNGTGFRVVCASTPNT